MCGSQSNSYEVTQVDYCVNSQLFERYEKFKHGMAIMGESVEEHLTFHGTSNVAIEGILQEGFKIGGQGVKVATGSRYGQGVYTSEDPEFAMRYIKDGRKRLLFAKVCLTNDSTIVRKGDIME